MGSQERKMAIKFDRKMGPREAKLKAMREAAALKPGPVSYVPAAIIALQAKVDAQAIEIARLKRELAQANARLEVTRDAVTSVTPVTLGPASRERIRARERKRKQRARERARENE
jgi:hypothetical protein